jgi:hypothetical protein
MCVCDAEHLHDGSECVYICVCVYVCVYLCQYMYVCVYVCVYVYVMLNTCMMVVSTFFPSPPYVICHMSLTPIKPNFLILKYLLNPLCITCMMVVSTFFWRTMPL